MSGQNPHFPTFRKAIRVFRYGAEMGGLASWISRTVLNERGLLRLGLYAILFICMTHIAAARVAVLLSGRGWTIYTPSYMGMGQPGADLITGSILAVTSFLLGGPTSEMAPFILVLCLGGLAASARVPEVARKPRVAVRMRPPVRPSPSPSEPVPTPPARHPLDPDPDDLPIEPRWPRTSRPST